MSRILKMIVAATLFGQAVMAQPAQPTTAPEAAPVGPPAGNADVPVRQRPTLSPQEMLNQGTDYRRRMDEAGVRVDQLLRQARDGKDIIRINCLTDKGVQVKANTAIADQALQALREAVARNDEGQSLHEYTRLTIVNQKIQILVAEADACVGEDLSYVGSTRVDVDTEGVPEDDFTQPGGPTVTPVRPPAASPYM